ncbi:hypothetical protein [Candidatus Williamhamiltonella defendens]|uniref:hypothetical protein n=1 Tax=Candidatus Williamhamiltonella defendens TaxID=138072 RepID=UPI00130E4031|nr:hypothetical protein [Candidatus Hamiltonella defensa]
MANYIIFVKFFQNKTNDKVNVSGSTDVLKSFANYEKIEVNRKNEQYLNILNKYIKDNPNILNILSNLLKLRWQEITY